MAKLLAGHSSEAKQDLTRAVSETPDGKLAQRIVDWTLQVQEANAALRKELVAFRKEATKAKRSQNETVQGINEMAETLREIRDLLRVQTARR